MCLGQILVDLERCQGYVQCALLAHAAVESRGDEVLHYDPVHLPRRYPRRSSGHTAFMSADVQAARAMFELWPGGWW
jgi:hypothetical protein